MKWTRGEFLFKWKKHEAEANRGRGEKQKEKCCWRDQAPRKSEGMSASLGTLGC